MTQSKKKRNDDAPRWESLGDGTIQIPCGEKRELTLRKERADAEFHTLAPAISMLDADLVFEGNGKRVSGLTCKQCGASTERESGNAAIVAYPGNYPLSPITFQCGLCGKGYGTISGLIEVFGPEDWRDQLALFRKLPGTQPVEREWVIAEADGARCMRPMARLAIDAALTPTTGSTVKLLKVIAYQEDQVLAVLHNPDLPMRETTIDRQARPLAPWNTRPTIAERNELDEAQRDHRREVEAMIDHELRALRSQKLAAAGL